MSDSDDSTVAEPVEDLLGTPPGEAPMTAAEWRTLASLRGRLFGDDAPAQPTIARYALLHPLGSGGFGTVYRAYDPDLHREVAIKLLDARRLPGADDEASARLLREAQAAAQLSHPNIVSVHDVGTFDGLSPTGAESSGQVFMVMELVEGQTVSAWFTQGAHPWRAVVDVFIQAGRGLAAAHAAGVVHRDFKPANVIIGDDGVVRVLDFGLARVGPSESGAGSRDSHRSRGSPDSRDGSGGSAPDDRLTQTGTVMGTPAYMAPEARRGQTVDARSDQYSFCVALYQGLHGRRPSSSADERRTRGVRVVPAWLDRAVGRGLCEDPSERWPSMSALLAALGRDPSVKRRRVASLAAVVGLSAVVAWGAARSRTEACPDAATQLAGVWDDARREQVHAAVQATAWSYAEQSWPRIRQRLDRYAQEWIEGHSDACAATHVRHEQSPALLDQRVRCLHRARRELGALVDVLSEANVVAVEKALWAVDRLPAVAHCADLERLRSETLPPPDDDVAEAVEEVREQLARINAQRSAGRLESAHAVAEAMLAQAEVLGYAPLRVEARLVLGLVLDDLGRFEEAEQQLVATFNEGWRHQHHIQAIKAASLLVMLVGTRRGRPQGGLVWAEIVAAELARRGAEHSAEYSDLLATRAAVYHSLGQFERAVEDLERSMEIRVREDGPRSEAYARVLGNLAVVHGGQGKLAQAQQELSRAIEIGEQALGSEHPWIARLHTNMGAFASRVGDQAQAERSLRRTLEISDAYLGVEHPVAVQASNNLGSALIEMGRFEEARPYIDRALQAWGASDKPELGMAMVNLAEILHQQGHHAQALAKFEQARDRLIDTMGPRHRWVATAMFGLASVYRSMDDRVKAAEVYREGVEIMDETAPDDPSLAHPVCALAEIDLTQDEPDAVAMARRCVALQRTRSSAESVAEAEFLLARAQWEREPATRDEAQQLARGARASATPAVRRKIEAWLRTHTSL